jgi:thiol-disulfide isomerase/thioredoxin
MQEAVPSRVDPAPPPEPNTAKPWRGRLRGWAVDVAVVLAVYLAFSAYQQRDAVRGAAPSLNAVQSDGRSVGIAQLRGQPALVHFWATWCGTCRAEQHNIEAIAKDTAVLTVASLSGGSVPVERYLVAEGRPFGAVADARGELAARFGVRAFPTTFVLDADGIIRHVEVGYSSELGLRIRLWLAKLGW